MPSARRVRMVLFTTILGLLTLLYITTGASSTRTSDFYQKTVSLMDARSRAADMAQQGRGQQLTPQEENETLRSRLRDAENAAKKSADERYRALRDVERVIKQNRDAAALEGVEEKSIAGRKMMAKEPLAAPLTSLSSTSSVSATKAAAAPRHGGEQIVLQEHQDDPAAHAIEEDMANILKRAPMVIFSKSYCPHSKKAKRVLLQAYSIEPPPYVVELDQHPKGAKLQELLLQTTGRRTVPNILINGKSMGGGDETERLWKSGELPVTVKQMSGKKIEKVTEKFPWVGEGGEQRPVLRKRS